MVQQLNLVTEKKRRSTKKRSGEGNHERKGKGEKLTLMANFITMQKSMKVDSSVHERKRERRKNFDGKRNIIN